MRLLLYDYRRLDWHVRLFFQRSATETRFHSRELRNDGARMHRRSAAASTTLRRIIASLSYFAREDPHFARARIAFRRNRFEGERDVSDGERSDLTLARSNSIRLEPTMITAK